MNTYPGIAACEGTFAGFISSVSAKRLCSNGWHVCTGHEVQQREIERTDRRDAEQRERDGTDRRDKQDVAPVVKRLDATKKHLMLEVAAGRMTEEEAKQIFAKVEKELAAAKQDKQDEQAKEEKVKRERR